MSARSPQRNKPLFFVHTVDLILWVYLMIFVRPFFRIVCFQYHGIKEIGFKRLEIGSLTYEESEKCHLAGLEFAKVNDLAKMCASRGQVTTLELDFTNYFAKEILRFYTELLLSGQMIRKLEDPHGVFILTRRFLNDDLHKAVVDTVITASGLEHSQKRSAVLSWFHVPLRGILAFFSFWAVIAVMLFQKRKAPQIFLQNKIVVVANNSSELQSDFVRQLSAGFMIDGGRIKKEDVLFLTRRGFDVEKWRDEGFCACGLIDLVGWRVHAEAVLRSILLFVTHLRLSFGLIACFPQTIMYYLVLSDVLLERYRFRGLIYTNSDVAVEPILSVPFLARKIPVILFYYSASTFVNPMWAYLQADHIFVWNKKMVEFLEFHPQNGEKQFLVSGPLMQVEDHFESAALKQLRDEFDINDDLRRRVNVGVFDIAPVKIEHLEKMRFVQSPKVTPEIHRDFLLDIFSLSGHAEDVRILLKPKRWTINHDLSPEIKECLKENASRVVNLPPALNPQVAIQSCQVVICFPFTSIFFAALQKGIPAVFYYPFEDVELKKIGYLQEFTIYGKENLRRWFERFCAGGTNSASPEKIYELCGAMVGVNIRESFISRLTEIL